MENKKEDKVQFKAEKTDLALLFVGVLEIMGAFFGLILYGSGLQTAVHLLISQGVGFLSIPMVFGFVALLVTGLFMGIKTMYESCAPSEGSAVNSDYDVIGKKLKAFDNWVERKVNKKLAAVTPGTIAERLAQIRVQVDEAGVGYAYKLTDKAGLSPFRSGSERVDYSKGTVFQATTDTDESYICSNGISLAAKDFVLEAYSKQKGFWDIFKNDVSRIFVMKFNVQDAVVPNWSDGRLRVSRCEKVQEITIEELKRR